MKKLIGSVLLGAGIIFANFLHAQATVESTSVSDLSTMLEAVEQTTPEPATNAPFAGNFYSAQHAHGTENEWPPLPGNVNNAQVWNLGDGFYLLDDLDTDYSQTLKAKTVRRSSEMSALDLSPSDDGDDDTNSVEMMSFLSTPIATNGLWLQITNVSNGLAYLNLMNGTDYVYEIFSKTDLTATNWNIENEAFPGINTNVMPFTVSQLNRTNLFIWARDWTGITSDGNTTPEWWFWEFYHTTNLSDTNLDLQGNTLLDDYLYEFDPNVIQFSLQFPSGYVDTSPVYGTIGLFGGIPAYMAVLINDTNQAHAVWQSYSPSVVANLNSGDGTYTVMVGLRGSAPNSTPTWLQTTLTLNTAPLVITVTNPVASTVWQPMIQLQGFASKPLASLNYSISNAAGVVTNQTGFVVGQKHDTNLLASTSYFQCYDLALTNGVNQVTLHATDIFGNSTTTNVNVTLNQSSATNPPALTLVWPTNNTVIAGTNFTLQGLLDDATASVIVSAGTNNFSGMVERDGRFSVAGLPLSGTNLFTVNATNVAGLGVSRTLTVVRGTVLVTINPPPASGQEFITVTGAVSDGSHDVYINGIKATVAGSTWSASNVPVVNNQGSGQLTANTYPTGSDTSVTPPTASQQTPVAMLPTVQAVSYQEQFSAQDNWYIQSEGNFTYKSKITRQWANGSGGTSFETFTLTPSDNYYYPISYTFNFNWPVYWPDGLSVVGTLLWVSPIWNISEAAGGPSPSTWGNANMGSSGAVPIDEDEIEPQTASRQFTRQAATEVQLVAGGPALAGNFQLIRLLVNAAGYSDSGLDQTIGFYYAYRFTGFEGPGDVPLFATNILVMGQAVMPTATNAYVGETYVVLPAGGVKNLPVSVTGTNSNNYSFNVQAQNVTLKIFANGIDLSTNTPEFCVGQQVTFSNAFDPPLLGLSSAVANWTLSDTFVNEANPSSGSTNYDENENLLTNVTTSAWWIDGGQKRVLVGLSLLFTNGQYLTVAAKGNFTVYRPTIINFNNFPPYYAALVHSQGQSGAPDELRLGDDSASGRMHHSLNVAGSFSGTANIIQLINANRAVSGTLGGQQSTTSGQFWLDNDLFYLDGTNDDSVLHFTPPQQAFLDLDDMPGYGLNLVFPTSLCSIVDSFEDYVVFRPDGTNSIYVPLGRVFWSWSASTSKTNGVWSNPTYQVNGPSSPDNSIELPTWPNKYNNTGN